MLVSELFDIKYGINLELDSLEQSDDAEAINFVARTAENNGVVARVKRIPGKEPQPAGILTCAGGGSVLSTFVQDKPFYSGRDLYLLIPKKEMSLEEKLFYCHAIKMNAYRYSYGRQANRTLKNINLPSLPDWLKKYKIDYSPIDTKIKHRELPFDTTKWKSFTVRDVFECNTTKPMIESVDGDKVYITRSAMNNGFSGFVSSDGYKLNNANCITIGAEGRFAFFQDKDFVAGVKIYTLRNEKLNKYNGLFVCTVLNQNVYKYSYGRARILDKIKQETIKLPADKDGLPDWDYMEKYIKSLPYSDLI